MDKIEWDHDLVISCRRSDNTNQGREGFVLARELEKRGLGVLLAHEDWPRDTLYFHEDGTYTHVDISDWEQIKHCDHQAYLGGNYILGDGFILASEKSRKRRKTEQILGVREGHYFDLSPLVKAFRRIKVSGSVLFYDSPKPLKHIDQFFNLVNRSRTILTYDEPNSIKMGEQMASLTGYKLELIPLREAEVAAVGFVETGSHAIVDRRAESTIEILSGLGLKPFPTPLPMERTNQYGGSLRCLTREMPKIVHRLKFYDFRYEGPNKEAARSHFSNTRWQRVVMKQAPLRRLREPLCIDPSFSLS